MRENHPFDGLNHPFGRWCLRGWGLKEQLSVGASRRRYGLLADRELRDHWGHVQRGVSGDGRIDRLALFPALRLPHDTAQRLESPTALQLRLFQTLTEIASENNSTVILPDRPLPPLLRSPQRLGGRESPPYERKVWTREASIEVAMIRLMLRRLASSQLGNSA